MKKKILSIVLIVIAVVVWYTAQDKYYKTKAIENTKYINKLSNAKLPGQDYAIKDILNSAITNPIWTQSKINDNKMLVSCSGMYGQKPILIEIYLNGDSNINKILYSNDSEKDVIITYNNKVMSSSFALKILYYKYAINSNIELTGKYKAGLKFIKLMSNKYNYDVYNLDVNEFTRVSDKYTAYIKTLDYPQLIDEFGGYQETKEFLNTFGVDIDLPDPNSINSEPNYNNQNYEDNSSYNDSIEENEKYKQDHYTQQQLEEMNDTE